MQTYTHAVFGTAVAIVLFPGDPLALIACVAASAGPDLVMVPLYVLDKVRGVKPLTKQGPVLMLLKEMSHSLVLWLLVLLTALYMSGYAQTLALSFALGGLGHVIIDMFTHGTGPRSQRPYWDTDTKFMWPTPIDLRPIGLWEYRIDYGVLTPKPFEALFLLVCATVAVTRTIFLFF